MRYQHSFHRTPNGEMVFGTLELHAREVRWIGENMCEVRGPSKAWGVVYRDGEYRDTAVVAAAPVTFITYDGKESIVGLRSYTSDTYDSDAFEVAGIAPPRDATLPVAYVMSNDAPNPFLLKHKILSQLMDDPDELFLNTVVAVVGQETCRNDVEEDEDESEVSSLAETVIMEAESQEECNAPL